MCEVESDEVICEVMVVGGWGKRGGLLSKICAEVMGDAVKEVQRDPDEQGGETRMHGASWDVWRRVLVT